MRFSFGVTQRSLATKSIVVCGGKTVEKDHSCEAGHYESEEAPFAPSQKVEGPHLVVVTAAAQRLWHVTSPETRKAKD